MSIQNGIRNRENKMRDIKFRAWDKQAKSWRFNSKTINDLCSGDVNNHAMWINLELMQYTGLEDKNGKEIYEGDIVEEPGNRYEVVYHADGFYMRNMYEPDNMLIQLRHGYLHCEVIGNIHENKELLS